MDPNASRELLDHSIMLIFVAALLDEDGIMLTYDRAKVQTLKRLVYGIKFYDRKATTDIYQKILIERHLGKVIITMNDGKTIEDKIERANAHLVLGPSKEKTILENSIC